MKWLFWLLLLIVFLILFPKMIKDQDNDKNAFLFVTILVLFFSAPLVYYSITIESSFGFIFPEQYDAWISFYGSIIGGILTVLGVWWTIIDQDKRRKEENDRRDAERKEDIKNEYLPIPTVTAKSDYNLDVSNNLYSITFKMHITNVGKGPMIKIQRHDIPFIAATERYKVTPQNYGFADPYTVNVGDQIITWFPPVKLPIDKENVDCYYYLSNLKYNDAFGRTFEVYYKFKFKLMYDFENDCFNGYGPNDYEVITKEEFEKILELPEYDCTLSTKE